MSTSSSARDDLPFSSSQCHRCACHRYIRSGKGSLFIMCSVLPQKYPRQPVSACPQFQPVPEDQSGSSSK